MSCLLPKTDSVYTAQVSQRCELISANDARENRHVGRRHRSLEAASVAPVDVRGARKLRRPGMRPRI